MRRRRERARLSLSLTPIWADGLKLLAIAAASFGFVAVLNQASGVPLPVLILLQNLLLHLRSTLPSLPVSLLP